MFLNNQYQLLDFGEGRKLERFGPYVLDRPASGTESTARRLPADDWRAAFACFVRGEAERGKWAARFPLPSTWCITHGSLTLEVKPTEFGHLGVFPEQAVNWDWIERQARAAGRLLKVLNLFAYTGGSTLAAAAAGAEVTHVDAAQNIVAWARQNAGLSGLADATIRWITEDAEKFLRREIKRGRAYNAVILDPPSFGHGPRGEVWKLADHLSTLLALCAEVTAADREFILLTCHSTGLNPTKLKRFLAEALGDGPPGRLAAETLSVEASTGERLPCGALARWVAQRRTR